MNDGTRAALVLGGLLLVSAAPVSAQDFEWRGSVDQGDAVEIRGVNGAIEAVASSSSQVRVTATKKDGRKGDADDVTIEVVEHAGGVLICAMYPNKPGKRENRCSPGDTHLSNHDNDTSVKFRVEVPVGINLVVGTVNGGIDVRQLDGDVKASTVNGGVWVESNGDVQVSTVNGSIVARMGKDLKSDLSFETVNGSVTVELPAGANAQISASTVTGGMESDFPLTIQGRFSNRQMNGQIGNGGHVLRLSTVNGAITLRRT